MEPKGFSTKIIHSAYLKEDIHHALHMPIYSNAAFEFGNAEQMENAFLGRQPDHMYSRISNPTVENFEQKIKAITGALSVTALSSGMAAISNVFFTFAEAGDNIITSKHLFGNSFSFFNSTLRAFGVEPRFCDLTNAADIERNIDKKTKALFFETITNPQLEVVDIHKLSAIARNHQLLLIADSTITPFNIFKAKDLGVNIEVISSTKIISGGATSIGGLIVDYGTFDWKAIPKLESLSHKFGPLAFNAKLRKEVFRNLGACLSPFNAYLQSLGLETLDLRYAKAASNCIRMAEFLKQHNRVVSVNFPGLKDSPFYEISKKQFGDLSGAILSFNLTSKEECFEFLNKLTIIRRATNLFDNKTLIMHPASTIFCEFSKEARDDMGVPDKLIRLSLGIEDIDDLIGDINNALN
jgi:O-acetylhomoserine (thiol)-lyase